VTATTLVVDAGMEDVLVTTAVEACDVVVAAVAENAEHRPSPIDAARWRSDWLQAERRQGATALWRTERPVPHWQASSAMAQPAREIADVRQAVAQKGSPSKFCAETKVAATTVARSVVRMLMEC